METIPALTIYFGQVSCGDEPRIVRTGSLCVHSVTSSGLVPEDKPCTGVTDALRAALFLVVLEEEGGGTRTPRVPFVTFAIRGPVVLIVAAATSTVSSVGLSRVSFKDDQFTFRTGTSSTHLVTMTLAWVLF